LCLVPLVAFGQPSAEGMSPAALQALGQGDSAAKAHAADAIGDQGAKAKGAVGALAAALHDSDPAVRWHVARALGAIGPDAAPAVSSLTAALADKDAKVRAYSAYALGEIGPAAKPALSTLAGMIEDTDATVRREAIKALGKVGPHPEVVDALVDVLKKAPAAEVPPALHSLAEFGDAVVPDMIEALDHEKARYWACLVLAEIGPKAKEAVPALVKALGDKRREVRREAVLALGHIGPGAAAAVPQIVPLLDDQGGGVRSGSVWSLGAMGPAAQAALPALKKKTADPDEMLSMLCAWAIARIEPGDAVARGRAREKLLATTTSKQPRVRATAIFGLADLKFHDPDVVHALVHALGDPDNQTAATAGQALVGMGDAAVGPLTESLSDEPLRGHAAAALGTLGPRAKSATGALVARLNDKNPEVRAETLYALGAIAPGDAQVLAAVSKSAASDTEPAVRYAAIEALSAAGAVARTALEAATRDKEPQVAAAAREALARQAAR
jgi:HEAT repeat protein